MGQDYQIIGGDVSFSGNRDDQVGVDCRGLQVRILDDPVAEETEEVVIMLHSNEPERITVNGFPSSMQYTSIIFKDNDGEYHTV